VEQSSLFGRGAQEIANVAAVPRRSPFRYPGGKTWLIPCLRRWLLSKNPRPPELLEPFAGGGTMSLTAAFEELAEHVTMVELDEQVAAVWTAILGEPGYARELADRIARFDLTPESVRAVLDSPGDSLVDRAFATILKNRVNRGGILAHRAGLVKNGERGKGLSSRWYPATLERRILEIEQIRDRISGCAPSGTRPRPS
jgi:DNA adenine methylase